MIRKCKQFVKRLLGTALPRQNTLFARGNTRLLTHGSRFVKRLHVPGSLGRRERPSRLSMRLLNSLVSTSTALLQRMEKG